MPGNPLLALQVQTPDVAGSFLAGQEDAQRARTARLSSLIEHFKLEQAQAQSQQQGQMRALLQQYGGAAAEGDPSAIRQISGLDPELGQKLGAGATAGQKTQLDLARERIGFLNQKFSAILAAPPEARPMLYSRSKAEAREMGLDITGAPPNYDENWIKQKAAETQTYQQRMDLQLREGAETRQVAADAETVRSHRAAEAGQAATLAETRRANLAKEGADVAAQTIAPAAIDQDSGSILAQTGLSMPAYMVLTDRAASLPRDRASRERAFREAEQFANARNVDVSTLASQFKANNETLQKNINRANSTKYMEDELSGTIDNLKPIADLAGQGKLRIANVARLWAGQEVNDPIVQQYAFQLNQLRSELAGYNAALRGKNDSDDKDFHEAERVIKEGLSSGGAEGLRQAVKSSTEKMSEVMQQGVDRSRRAVWELFGVGDRFKPAARGGSATSIPEAARAQLREGAVTTFGNGQRWTLRGGKPEQVK